MILIEGSTTGASGGALVLLQYLLKELKTRKVDFFLLKDPRWIPEQELDFQYSNSENTPILRGCILKKYLRLIKPQTLLCMGSFPPPFKVSREIKVVTFFQNPNLLDFFNEKNLYNFTGNVKWQLKKRYLKLFLENTDYFVFQTPFIRNQFELEYKSDRISHLTIPFYEDERLRSFLKGRNQESIDYDFCYISLPYPHKGHVNLINALRRIKSEFGLKPSLVITCPQKFNDQLDVLIDKAYEEELKLINVGLVDIEEAWLYQLKSKACIFPTTRETFGLGLVEACMMGKMVLASDIPVLNDVLEPSLSFDPNSVEEIANAMIHTLNEVFPIGSLKVENRIADFVKLING